MTRAPTLYLASPWGFSEAGRIALVECLRRIRGTGWQVVDPWDLSADFPEKAACGAALESAAQAKYFDALVHEVGARNEHAIREVDLVLAVLDGPDIDSGVAAEIGFARAIGKRVIGYRGDFRSAGEAPGIVVNLQVQHFIAVTGGRIVRSLAELAVTLQEARRASTTCGNESDL